MSRTQQAKKLKSGKKYLDAINDEAEEKSHNHNWLVAVKKRHHYLKQQALFFFAYLPKFSLS